MPDTEVFDVRPLLAKGEDPFEAIQSAWAALGPGQRLAIGAPFEPRPLAAFFSSQGIPVQWGAPEPGLFWLLVGPKTC